VLESVAMGLLLICPTTSDAQIKSQLTTGEIHVQREREPAGERIIWPDAPDVGPTKTLMMGFSGIKLIIDDIPNGHRYREFGIGNRLWGWISCIMLHRPHELFEFFYFLTGEEQESCYLSDLIREERKSTRMKFPFHFIPSLVHPPNRHALLVGSNEWQNIIPQGNVHCGAAASVFQFIPKSDPGPIRIPLNSTNRNINGDPWTAVNDHFIQLPLRHVQLISGEASLPRGDARIGHNGNYPSQRHPKHWLVFGPSALLAGLACVGVGWRCLWTCAGWWPEDRRIVAIGLALILFGWGMSVWIGVHVLMSLPLTSADRLTKDVLKEVLVLPVVVPELELGDEERSGDAILDLAGNSGPSRLLRFARNDARRGERVAAGRAGL
jgi:hypothetical protein